MMKWLSLLAWVVGCVAVGGLGAWLGGTMGAVDPWYREIAKPSWTPPDRIFGPVWTILYMMMGVAAWRVTQRSFEKRIAAPLVVFGVQLLANLLWSWLFFGIHRIDLALIDIGVLLVSLAATIVLFLRVDRVAGLLLLPYLCWVSFATPLNATIWRLNP